MRRHQVSFLMLALALPAQEPQADTPDPALARIRARLQEADAARARDRHEDARAIVREALAACVALPGLAQREDAHVVLAEVGKAAERATEWRTAHDAYERMCESLARTLPDDHAALQRARLSLATTKCELGDLPGAHTLEEKVYQIWSRTLPDDHRDLQRARGNLATTKYLLGDLRSARALYEKVHEVFRHTLPDDHRDLQWARQNLALTLRELGDLRGALALLEQVYETARRTLPDDHPDLQRARGDLAATKHLLGDLRSARALLEKAYEVSSRTLPDDHAQLQVVRHNLANTERQVGNLTGARALLEKVYEVSRRTLPDDHLHLQAVRQNLAIIKGQLGDQPGARALLEKVYEVSSRTLPDDHLQLQIVRQNLASTKLLLGDVAGARVLVEKSYEVSSRTLPDDHESLQSARMTLAIAKRRLGDLAGARALQEKVYEVWSRTLPDDNSQLQRAQGNLAITKRAIGDLAGAHALLEKIYGFWSRALPDDHTDLQTARENLAITKRALGDAAGTLRLARERAAAARRSLSAWTLAPRELGALAAQEQAGVDLLLSLAGGFGTIEAQPEAGDLALMLSQTLCGVQSRAARGGRRARTADPERAAALERDLRTAAAEVSRVAGAPVEGNGAALEARRRERAERLARAVDDKERLERELAALGAKAGHVALASASVGELAAALPERSAAVAIVGFTHAAPDPRQPGRTIDEARLAALVLDREARVQLVPLGRVAEVGAVVEALRREQQAHLGRGLAPSATTGGAADKVDVAAAELCERVMVPVLAACGTIDTLYIVTDDVLQLVPLDALPLDGEHLVGNRVALRPLVSLLDLLEPPGLPLGAAPGLLVGGGIDYGRAAKGATALLAPHASPAVERGSEAAAWISLPGTAREAAEIASLFAQALPEGKAEYLADERAGKAQIAAAAPRVTFVHLATHGYFAPENIESTADATTTTVEFGQSTITGLSPLALCGLALSGANLPPDELGRRAGILTAEEILSIDLSRCQLVTLSACDTSLGVRRAGEGYASLRAALQGAGARFVLTSLWKVGDEATMELMIDFYRRLWVQKKEPHTALWEAKMEARRKGAPFRDWAGWVLTGR
jgi:CHAT domain-containing protein